MNEIRTDGTINTKEPEKEKKEIIELNKAKEKIMQYAEDFMCFTKEQMYKCIGDHEVCGQALSKLIKGKKLNYNETSGYYEYAGYDEKDISGAYGLRKAFAVYCDYIGNGAEEYVIAPDKDIMMTFVMEEHLIDIIYIPFGKELTISQLLHMKERYLSDKDKKDLCRIVIVDKEKQIKDIQIMGTQFFAMVDNNGNTEYM